jgi:hypothetical protein
MKMKLKINRENPTQYHRKPLKPIRVYPENANSGVKRIARIRLFATNMSIGNKEG